MTTHQTHNNPTEKPYGSWSSPISSALIVSDAITLDELRLFQSNAYWIEKRPQENGRCVIVQYKNGNKSDLLPIEYSARSRCHEYGGASYIVTIGGIFFINNSDQQIYHIDQHSTVVQITTFENLRFADMTYDNEHHRIICVCEDHTHSSHEAVTTIVSININDGLMTTLCEGYDFYSNPRLSSDGKQLVWLCWNHPNMPWDATECWLADISGITLTGHNCIAGSDSISICQPSWSPDDTLTYVSDESGWWNIYRYENRQSRNVFSKQAEFGLAGWIFGQSSYQYVDDNIIHCIYSQNACDTGAELNLSDSTITPMAIDFTTLSSIQTDGQSTWFIAASATRPPQVVSYNISTKRLDTVCISDDIDIEATYLSPGINIEFTTRHDDLAYAVYYPPHNTDFTSSGKPPLIVLSHGGPTSRTSNAFDMRKQFWTSRGFALVDVNYSGSTGFGRAYRQRLNGSWGIRDVEDCCDAALYAVNEGLADPEQLIIKGGSAGGYCVLSALTFHDVFSAGASYYGIGELETLATDTHKFESRYLDNLIAPYPAGKQIYLDRSPIHHVDLLNCPVIFFQGSEDYVVPQVQAEKMVSAIDKKGLPVAYLLFEGEGHGFRQAQTIEDTLNAEYYFYAKIFGFELSETRSLIDIRNLTV